MRAFLVFAVCCIAGPALAGGPVETVVEPVPAAASAAPDFSWTGVYAGVSLTNGTANDSSADFDTSGYGVELGYLRDLGRIVAGAELAYSKGDYGDAAPESDWTATRLKLIGGYDAGRFLPYLFVGLTNYDIDQSSPYSDSMTSYGLGARFALGATGKLALGLEYLKESKSDFDDSGFKLTNDEVALRLDYRF